MDTFNYQKKHEPPTKVFSKAGLDNEISAMGKSQLQFQQTNIYQLLYLTSSTYFQSAAVMGRRDSNSQPA